MNMKPSLSRAAARRGCAGLTLLEILIVTAVLTTLASLAIPAVLRAKKSANETGAIATLKAVSNAQIQHRVRYGRYGTLANLEERGLVDGTLSDGEKSGYTFTDASVPDVIFWSVHATPLEPGISGDRHFYLDTAGVVHFRQGEPAKATDAAIQ
jgi:prepilin-type N-terminal cleavage/methylation domain-containing protein